MKQTLRFFSILSLISLALMSCKKDSPTDITKVSNEKIEKAKNWLNGDVVLSCKATLNGVDKTFLPTGCPTKFNFKWNSDGTVTIALIQFKVGKMPMAVNYKCRLSLIEPNTWERDEYKGDDWIKLYGKDGATSLIGVGKEDHKEGSGSTVEGFLNVQTGEITFTINFNMMNVKTTCIPQKIDKDRINHYDEEKKKYEEDLAKYKKDHGIDNPSTYDSNKKHAEKVDKAKKLLLGDLVLTGRTGVFNWVNPNDSSNVVNIDMTKLPTGCPMKYNFNWNEKDSSMTMSLPKFKIGAMPFAISFHINVKFMELDAKDKEKYNEKGWLKIIGKNGSSKGGEEDFGDSAHVDGFINVESGDIELNTHYEVHWTGTYLPIETRIPRQKIDRDLINHYDDLVKKYEEDLAKWEDQHPERGQASPAYQTYRADNDRSNNLLNGDIVLSCKTSLKGIDKTLLPSGCPTKFNFRPNKDGTITMALLGFKVGKMPFPIYFRCRLHIVELNAAERNTHKGNGWYKIVGKDGATNTILDLWKNDVSKNSGAGVDGFINIETSQISFNIDFNKMGVLSHCFLQKIDKTRINRYDEELKKYNEDLKKFKSEHGIH